MSIEKITRPYEIKIRFHPDGSASIQHESLTVITEDGAVISEQFADLINIDISQCVAILNESVDYVPPPVDEAGE